jgi:4-aminobutyrate aminotransferase-like enzyme
VNTRETLELLRTYESRNVLYAEADGSWPIVWEKAKGVHVWDAEGKKYLDLTAAFGVAAAGHGNPKVVKAAQQQMNCLLHAMGDVHPHARKAELARELSRITFERWTAARMDSDDELFPRSSRDANHRAVQRGKTIFCNSGFEAVEAALKTAMLATGRQGVIVFHGAYHGLGYGTLNATHRDHFRAPFKMQLKEFGHFVQFPGKPADLPVIELLIRRLFQRGWVGAILVEPVQARGGINVPPVEFLPMLRRLSDEHKALLILDEIYTGFGRTGKWFACEHSGVLPDLICLGKALTGGFPLSACVGRADLMDAAWPASQGEAIHTSTFLGHPVGCAMALAQIAEIESRKLPERSAGLGEFLLQALQIEIVNAGLQIRSRGIGLMSGVDLRLPNGEPATAATISVIKVLLHRGYILLPEGEAGNVISFTPPLTITKAQLAETIAVLAKVVKAL